MIKEAVYNSPGNAFAAFHMLKRNIQWLWKGFKLVNYYMKADSNAQVSTRHLSLSVRTATQLQMQAFC